jgi:hypothetical protein
MRLRFTKENMYTGAGFVYDSFQADLAAFQAVAPKEFTTAFVTGFFAKRDKIKKATGAALRTGTAAQTTVRLYENMDKVKPLLDRLDIRLGLIPKKDLTVAASKFGLKTLRERIGVRDAEATSRALTVLEQAVTDNFDVLEDKGHSTTEQQELVDLHKLIDEDNALQNVHMNTNTGATLIEDADYLALNAVLSTVMRTGRLLHKTVKQKRQQYESASILKRMEAGEKPKPAVAPPVG